MMTPGEKAVAVGVLATLNVPLWLGSAMWAGTAYLAAGSLIASLPLAVSIANQ